MKKLFSLFLAICMLLPLVSAMGTVGTAEEITAASASFDYDSLYVEGAIYQEDVFDGSTTWELNDASELVIEDSSLDLTNGLTVERVAAFTSNTQSQITTGLGVVKSHATSAIERFLFDDLSTGILPEGASNTYISVTGFGHVYQSSYHLALIFAPVANAESVGNFSAYINDHLITNKLTDCTFQYQVSNDATNGDLSSKTVKIGTAGITLAAVRVYNKVLTDAERKQNRFADLAKKYALDVTKYLLLDAEGKEKVHDAVVTAFPFLNVTITDTVTLKNHQEYYLGMQAPSHDAITTVLDSAVQAQLARMYRTQYVQDGLVAFFDASQYVAGSNVDALGTTIQAITTGELQGKYLTDTYLYYTKLFPKGSPYTAEAVVKFNDGWGDSSGIPEQVFMFGLEGYNFSYNPNGADAADGTGTKWGTVPNTKTADFRYYRAAPGVTSAGTGITSGAWFRQDWSALQNLSQARSSGTEPFTIASRVDTIALVEKGEATVTYDNTTDSDNPTFVFTDKDNSPVTVSYETKLNTFNYGTENPVEKAGFVGYFHGQSIFNGKVLLDETTALKYYNTSGYAGEQDGSDFQIGDASGAAHVDVALFRVYDRALSADEQKWNHFVDLAYLYDLDLGGWRALKTADRQAVANEFAEETFMTETSEGYVARRAEMMTKLNEAVEAKLQEYGAQDYAEAVLSFLGYQAKINTQLGLRSLYQINTYALDAWIAAGGQKIEIGAIMAIKGERTSYEGIVLGATQAASVTVYDQGAEADPWTGKLLDTDAHTFAYTTLFSAANVTQVTPLTTELLYRGYVSYTDENDAPQTFYINAASSFDAEDQGGIGLSIYDLSKRLVDNDPDRYGEESPLTTVVNAVENPNSDPDVTTAVQEETADPSEASAQ